MRNPRASSPRKKLKARWTPDERDWRTKLSEGVAGNVQDVAKALDVPASVVYLKWRELGGVKIGRVIRFDLSKVRDHLSRLNHQGDKGANDKTFEE